MSSERPTVLPPYDVERYAKDSDARLAVVERLPHPLEPDALLDDDSPSQIRHVDAPTDSPRRRAVGGLPARLAGRLHER